MRSAQHFLVHSGSGPGWRLGINELLHALAEAGSSSDLQNKSIHKRRPVVGLEVSPGQEPCSSNMHFLPDDPAQRAFERFALTLYMMSKRACRSLPQVEILPMGSLPTKETGQAHRTLFLLIKKRFPYCSLRVILLARYQNRERHFVGGVET